MDDRHTHANHNKQKTRGRLLMEITAISGEYPADNILRLIPTHSYAKKVISSLIGGNMIKQVSTGGLKGYRLTAKGKRSLISDNPAGFAGFLSGSIETNKMRSGYERRLRLHSLAEVCTLMYCAGVEIFADSKPGLFLHSEQSPIAINVPCFYTSREQKGQDDNAIRGSRAAGTLLTPSHVYAVYNTGNTESRWSEKVEQRFKVELHSYICRNLLSHQYQDGLVSGVMIGASMAVLEKYLVVRATQPTAYHFLTKAYSSFYYITNDNCGEAQIKLLCETEKMTGLRNILQTGLHPPDSKHHIEHDALTKDGNPVLFCCLLNIPRLIRFRNGTVLHNKIGKIIAFDFQIDVLRRYFGDTVEFVSISFDKFVRRFLL